MAVSSPTFRPIITIPGTTSNVFNEIFALASGSLTNIVTYTVPVGKDGVLEKVSVSGSNVAKYSIFVNATEIESAYSYFGGQLNVGFDFTSQASGYKLLAGDVVAVKVIHSRAMLGDFAGRIQVVEI